MQKLQRKTKEFEIYYIYIYNAASNSSFIF